MSQLMQMRQRIKAVQTIKKITHAMRLISMSTHSRMKHQEKALRFYQETLYKLLLTAQQELPTSHNPVLNPIAPLEERPLAILIGSQKGLCGGFNTALFQLFASNMASKTNYSIITVGKRAKNYVQKNDLGQLTSYYETFGMHNILALSNSLLNEVIKAKKPYSSVIVYSNSAPSFFLQKPIARQLIPMEIPTDIASHENTYTLEQSPAEILSFLGGNYILSHLQQALFQSLLAEHAARFVSMDSSTRNAEKLLENMQSDYNKLRQSKITRELTELSSFFID